MNTTNDTEINPDLTAADARVLRGVNDQRARKKISPEASLLLWVGIPTVLMGVLYGSLVLPHGALDPCGALGNKVYAHVLREQANDPNTGSGERLGLALFSATGRDYAQTLARAQDPGACLISLMKNVP